MIRYKREGLHFVFNVFRCYGSVFPFAACIALPCALLTLSLRMAPMYAEGDQIEVLKDSAVWNSFSFVVGFLVVFRTSQAYARFWDGCTSTHRMCAEFYNSSAALVSFCKFSKEKADKVEMFKHVLVRLVSMLNAAACAEIEDSNSDDPLEVTAFHYELLDGEAIDEESLRTIRDSDCKVELIFQWIQQFIVENIETGILTIPAPILTRAFQELACGMVAFRDAVKISTIPFPFPYAQTCDALLMMHWLFTPFVVAQWSCETWAALVFTFFPVFFFWCLNRIAVEIENPFGSDSNDLDMQGLQREINQQLMNLVGPQNRRTPMMSEEALAMPAAWERRTIANRRSFLDIWSRQVMVEGNQDSKNSVSVAPSLRRPRGSRRSSEASLSQHLGGDAEAETRTTRRVSAGAVVLPPITKSARRSVVVGRYPRGSPGMQELREDRAGSKSSRATRQSGSASADQGDGKATLEERSSSKLSYTALDTAADHEEGAAAREDGSVIGASFVDSESEPAVFRREHRHHSWASTDVLLPLGEDGCRITASCAPPTPPAPAHGQQAAALAAGARHRIRLPFGPQPGAASKAQVPIGDFAAEPRPQLDAASKAAATRGDPAGPTKIDVVPTSFGDSAAAAGGCRPTAGSARQGADGWPLAGGSFATLLRREARPPREAEAEGKAAVHLTVPPSPAPGFSWQDSCFGADCAPPSRNSVSSNGSTTACGTEGGHRAAPTASEETAGTPELAASAAAAPTGRGPPGGQDQEAT